MINRQLVSDPIIYPPRFNLHHRLWSVLNSRPQQDQDAIAELVNFIVVCTRSCGHNFKITSLMHTVVQTYAETVNLQHISTSTSTAIVVDLLLPQQAANSVQIRHNRPTVSFPSPHRKYATVSAVIAPHRFTYSVL